MKLNKKNGWVKVFSRISMLLVLGFLGLITLQMSMADWESYGRDEGSSHYQTTTGNMTSLSSPITLTLGQDSRVDILLTDAVSSNPGLEGLVFNGSKLVVVNLSNARILASHDLGMTPTGQVDVHHGSLYGVFVNNSEVVFAEIDADDTSVTINFSIPLSSIVPLFDGEGTKCTTSGSKSYCVFMTRAHIGVGVTGVYRVTIDDKSVSVMPHTFSRGSSGMPHSNNNRVPAIIDIDKDGDQDALIPYFNASPGGAIGKMFVMSYDIQNNQSTEGWNNGGSVEIASDNANLFVIDYSNIVITTLDGNVFAALTHPAGTPEAFTVLNGSGAIVHQNNSLYFDPPSYSEPFYNACNYNGSGVTDSVAVLAAINNGGLFLLAYEGSNATRSIELNDEPIISSPAYGFPTNHLVSSADFDSDGDTEFIAGINGTGGGNMTLFSCKGEIIQVISENDGVYNPVIDDVNSDGQLDAILQRKGKSKVYTSGEILTDLEITSITPIQVVEGVSMVSGKTGLVRITVQNSGLQNAQATVTATLQDNPLEKWDNPGENSITKPINAGNTETFDFKFIPSGTGTQTFSASVEVS